MLNPQDIPRSDVERLTYRVRLPAELARRVDAIVARNKNAHPEICTWRSRFVETALNHFVRNFDQLVGDNQVPDLDRIMELLK